MLCKNCEKEIGNNSECSFCGYNPAKDDCFSAENIDSNKMVRVPPVKIELKKSKNGSALTGFILGFFAIEFVPIGMMSFIFSLIGFFKAKKCRAGRVLSILGLISSTLCGLFWAFAIYVLYNDLQQYIH